MVFMLRRISALANNRRLLLLIIALTVFFILITHFYQKLDVLENLKPGKNLKSGGRFESFVSAHENIKKWSRIASYCNSPHQIEINSESLPPEIQNEYGLKLSSVAIAIRHGDRGPLRYLRHLDKIDCTVGNYLPQSTVSSEYSEKTVDGRHHNLLERYLKAMSFDFHKILDFPRGYRIVPEDGCHPEQLTLVGALQHLILGSKLADVYLRQLNIESMSVKKFMKVYSTNYQRTFQSAFAFLFGFIDPTSTLDHKHFPTIESTHGHVFCGSVVDNKFCSKCDKLQQISKLFDEMRVKSMSSNQAIIDAVFKIRALIAPSNTSATFQSFEALFDGVMTYLCHDSAIPCDDFNGCATDKDIKQLIESLENLHLSMVKSKEYRKMNLIKTFGFYQRLVDHFNKVNKNSDFFKVLLFSGHDVTLIPIASVLNIYDGVIPPFASRFIFETYKSKIGVNYLRVVYNGKDMTKSVEICNSSTHCVQLQHSKHKSFFLIRLDAFHHFIQIKLKELTNSDTYENACTATT